MASRIVAIAIISAVSASCANHYGYQIAGAQVVASATHSIGTKHKSKVVRWIGDAEWLVSPAAIHALHGNWGRAAFSLGSRAGVVALAASLLRDDDGQGSDDGRAIRAVFAGLFILSAIGGLTIIDIAIAVDHPSHPPPPPAALTFHF